MDGEGMEGDDKMKLTENRYPDYYQCVKCNWEGSDDEVDVNSVGGLTCCPKCNGLLRDCWKDKKNVVDRSWRYHKTL